MVVNLEPGQVPEGGLVTPTNTMFQFCPLQLPQTSFLESHCCCVMELTVESTLESARNPPLDQAPLSVFARFRFPLICMRRRAVPWDTAHVIVLPLVGVTARFSQARQKFIVAL